MAMAMRPQEFLEQVRVRAEQALPDDQRPVFGRVVYGMLQMHYGNPRIHFEVWLVRKTGRIEIGLHCEDERARNEQAATALAARAHELRDGGGEELELEQWTASWTRLHLTLPLGPLTDQLCDQTAGRLARLITVTLPVLGSLATRAGRQAAVTSPRGRRMARR